MADGSPKARPPSAGAPVGSFIGWAFLLSIAIHAILLPFVHLKTHSADKQEVEKISETHKIKVRPPTPPPPTPTPPPPTPPPKSTPPPVKQTNPPPQPKLVVKPPKTTANTNTGPTEKKYVEAKGSENGVPQGTVASAPPAPVSNSTAPPATPAPTPTPTPKPACANPNAPAAIKGSPVEPDYPDIAREQGAVGTALVKVTLSATGSVTDVSINKSAGNAALDKAAMDAAKSTQYVPETDNCVPTAGSYLFQADFTGQ
jgi:protein TonB